MQFSKVLLKWLKFHTGKYCSVHSIFFLCLERRSSRGYKWVSFMQGKMVWLDYIQESV